MRMIDIKKSLQSFKYAGRGLLLLVKTENNARIHLVCSLFALALGFICQLTRFEWIWIILAIAVVWIAEAFNTALEVLTDFVSPNFDARAGKVKDLAAGGVLVAAIMAALIGIFIFLPYLMKILLHN